MEELEDYKKIHENHNDYFLYGNGLSISIWEEFRYNSLYKVCCGEEGYGESLFSKEAIQLFGDFDTTNFEWVLYALHLSERVNSTLNNTNGQVREVYENIKSALINAVHKIHINFEDLPSDQLRLLNGIFKSFQKGIFTTNYDLISYWTLMYKSNGLSDLFFYNNIFDIKETLPKNKKVPLYFLHGALHLFKENGETKKLVRSWDNLLDRIQENIEANNPPLFVSQGTSEQKLKTITSSDYLAHCYKQLSQISGGLTIYGSSLRPEDEHIVSAIKKSNIKKIAYSIYVGSNTSLLDIKKEMAKTEKKFENIEVTFYKHSSFFQYL